jgi:hypothetical protein
MPTVDGPFAYPASRFSTNLGPRAMLDWEEGQAEEAALIDARTNADLGSGRTPRYDTAIGPQPAPPALLQRGTSCGTVSAKEAAQ